jgi:CHASE3 domain sensor protein
MELKEKTLQEIEKKLDQIENLIAEKGVGSGQLKKAERIQRDLNLALIVGGAATVLGLTAWSIYKWRDN